MLVDYTWQGEQITNQSIALAIKGLEDDNK